jgi:hypothetical protein
VCLYSKFQIQELTTVCAQQHMQYMHHEFQQQM